MWETPFETSFLFNKQGVVIRCQEEEISHQLFDILKENNIIWYNMNETRWDVNKEETAYFVRDKQIQFGPYCHAENDFYINYIRCTFYGDVDDGSTQIEEDEWMAVLMK